VRPIVVTREVDCGSGRDAIWRIVSDTERLNRAIGLTRLELTPISNAGAARYLVSTEQGGFRLEYDERPFEWVEGERFSVKRVVRRGMVQSVTTTFELASRADGGTHVRVILTVEPKSAVTGLLVRLSVGQVAEKMLHEIVRADAELMRGAASMKGVRPVVNGDALERARKTLVSALPAEEHALAAQLVDYLKTAADVDVERIRPFELADAWGVERRAALAVSLSAVIAGLLELSWEIICPSCMTGAGRVPTLAELGAEGHCQLCDLSFGVELDKAVEATFRPSPAVRSVAAGPYCIGGPRRTPHVFAQTILPPAGKAELPAPQAIGRYRLFVRGGAAASVEVSAQGAARAELRFEANALTPATIAVAPGGEITVAQSAPEERHAKLERLEWASSAATAHFVTTLPTFRRQFAREVLRPGVVLRVARVALLFSDLTDSTALYSRTGDAIAFRVVHDHFDLLRTQIEANHGTIIKTIGDAVMAAFIDEKDAFRAAIGMQRAFPGFRAAHPEALGVKLKLGVYAGPCYGVTANDTLDYFGQSVNIAARLQGKAQSGEVVVGCDLADLAERSGWLDGSRISERFVTELKGVEQPIRVARILVDDGL
jgi:adenylate cyclase